MSLVVEQGTEAEPFINKLRKGGSNNPSTNKVNNKALNSNWRQKHEEFINAIRAAKQVQAHLQAGGNKTHLFLVVFLKTICEYSSLTLLYIKIELDMHVSSLLYDLIL